MVKTRPGESGDKQSGKGGQSSSGFASLDSAFFRAWGEAANELGFGTAAIRRAAAAAWPDQPGRADFAVLLVDDSPRDEWLAWLAFLDGEAIAAVNARAENGDPPATGKTAAIRAFVEARLSAALPFSQALGQMNRMKMRPAFALTAAAADWRTADAFWKAAGDDSTGLDYHSRRVTLAAFYAMAERRMIRTDGAARRRLALRPEQALPRDARRAVIHGAMALFDRRLGRWMKTLKVTKHRVTCIRDGGFRSALKRRLQGARRRPRRDSAGAEAG